MKQKERKIGGTIDTRARMIEKKKVSKENKKAERVTPKFSKTKQNKIYK